MWLVVMVSINLWYLVPYPRSCWYNSFTRRICHDSAGVVLDSLPALRSSLDSSALFLGVMAVSIGLTGLDVDPRFALSTGDTFGTAARARDRGLPFLPVTSVLVFETEREESRASR